MKRITGGQRDLLISEHDSKLAEAITLACAGINQAERTVEEQCVKLTRAIGQVRSDLEEGLHVRNPEIGLRNVSEIQAACVSREAHSRLLIAVVGRERFNGLMAARTDV